MRPRDSVLAHGIHDRTGAPIASEWIPQSICLTGSSKAAHPTHTPTHTHKHRKLRAFHVNP